VATLQTKVCKVQKTIDALIDNDIHGQPMRNSHDRPYKSIFYVIEGKEGRFHEYIYIYIYMSILIVCYTSNLFDKKQSNILLQFWKYINSFFFFEEEEEIDHTCIYGLMKSHKVFLIITYY
jgi:hypothetical protein